MGICVSAPREETKTKKKKNVRVVPTPDRSIDTDSSVQGVGGSETVLSGPSMKNAKRVNNVVAHGFHHLNYVHELESSYIPPIQPSGPSMRKRASMEAHPFEPPRRSAAPDLKDLPEEPPMRCESRRASLEQARQRRGSFQSQNLGTMRKSHIKGEEVVRILAGPGDESQNLPNARHVATAHASAPYDKAVLTQALDYVEQRRKSITLNHARKSVEVVGPAYLEAMHSGRGEASAGSQITFNLEAKPGRGSAGGQNGQSGWAASPVPLPIPGVPAS